MTPLFDVFAVFRGGELSRTQKVEGADHRAVAEEFSRRLWLGLGATVYVRRRGEREYALFETSLASVGRTCDAPARPDRG